VTFLISFLLPRLCRGFSSETFQFSLVLPPPFFFYGRRFFLPRVRVRFLPSRIYRDLGPGRTLRRSGLRFLTHFSLIELRVGGRLAPKPRLPPTAGPPVRPLVFPHDRRAGPTFLSEPLPFSSFSVRVVGLFGGLLSSFRPWAASLVFFSFLTLFFPRFSGGGSRS